VPQANALSKAVADLEQMVKTRKLITDVSWSGSQTDGATTGTSELKSLTQNSVTERRWTALLRGRKLRLPWRMASGNRQPREGAPNAGAGKRVRRTPIPHLSLFDRKVEQGLIVFTHEARGQGPGG